MLNSNGICDACNGKVRNATGRRLTIEQLTIRHNEHCPGIRRVKKGDS